MGKMFDISFERCSDGSICLTQTENGEDSVIVLALEQVKFIARRLCGFKEADVGRVADLERKIAVLTDRLQYFACNTYFREEIIERVGDGMEIIVRLDALVDLALEFDGGRLKPEYPGDETQKPIYPPSGKTISSSAAENAAKADSVRSGSIPDGQLDLIAGETDAR